MNKDELEQIVIQAARLVWPIGDDVRLYEANASAIRVPIPPQTNYLEVGPDGISRLVFDQEEIQLDAFCVRGGYAFSVGYGPKSKVLAYRLDAKQD